MFHENIVEIIYTMLNFFTRHDLASTYFYFSLSYPFQNIPVNKSSEDKFVMGKRESTINSGGLK